MYVEEPYRLCRYPREKSSMETKHDYMVEIQTRKEDNSSVVEARTSILAENDADAQQQAEEWARTAAALAKGATYLVIRHDDRVVVDQELRKSMY